MGLAEDAYYGEIRAKKLAKQAAKKLKPAKVTAKRKRTMAMNRELAKKKREMWDAAVVGRGPGWHYPECGLCGVFLGHRNGNRAQLGTSLEAYLAKPLAERRAACRGGQ